jgi:transposase
MSQAYISGVERVFPKANIVFDKFHIVQHLNKAMNTVRRDERRGNDALKGHKYTFLKSNKNIKELLTY